jgi:hypothetical protein
MTSAPELGRRAEQRDKESHDMPTITLQPTLWAARCQMCNRLMTVSPSHVVQRSCTTASRHGQTPATPHDSTVHDGECSEVFGRWCAAENAAEVAAEAAMSAWANGYREPTWDDQREEEYERWVASL